ncbi:hypothetical protein BC937DRAFT_90994 [Endogone sp. FLAS-F59071]|nr:hypothetical protein BC937DRAFT_90994 [Endogone sp. FLAS-F59071]|eukprot:RUS16613.1 hypothetical protein BC937DRAFT_90994 [Endogone sp. FLAS-F59071]
MADFLDLLKSEDDTQNAYDPSTYFQFKEDTGWDGGDDGGTDELYASLMQIRFDELEASLATVPLGLRLGIEERDLVMVSVVEISMLAFPVGEIELPFRIDDPSAFEASPSVPIVPKVLRSEALIVKKPGGAVPAATTVTNVAPTTTVLKPGDEDVPVTKSSPAHKLTSRESVPRATARPRPGTASTASRGSGEDDFDRFLDEIDGSTEAKDLLAKRASPAALPRGPKPLARPPLSGRPGPSAPAAHLEICLMDVF